MLVNNAGIAGGRMPVPETTAATCAHVFETNVFGIVRVTQAFLPLLERSANPVDRECVQRHGLVRRHDRP